MIIHDLTQPQAEKMFEGSDDACVISKQKPISPCTGCFGCWIKTPGTCVIGDGYENMGKMLSEAKELLIISECAYGGFSPFVKNVLDRSIGYMHPDFRILNGEMHHKKRYENSINLKVCFYGEDITASEKETAEGLIKGVAINFFCKAQSIDYFSITELMEGEYV